VTLYLFALPMTLVNDMGWAAVPVTTAVAFTFMGIEGIADEIEMPFGLSPSVSKLSIFLTFFYLGNDDRDLPLGMFLLSYS
jgi:predicted membrane chloride channel (bestrophin family)